MDEVNDGKGCCWEEACHPTPGFHPRTGPPPGFEAVVPLGPPPAFEQWDLLKEHPFQFEEKAPEAVLPASRIAGDPPAQILSPSLPLPHACNEASVNYSSQNFWSTCHTKGFDLRTLYDEGDEFLTWILTPGDYIGSVSTNT